MSAVIKAVIVLALMWVDPCAEKSQELSKVFCEFGLNFGQREKYGP